MQTLLDLPLAVEVQQAAPSIRFPTILATLYISISLDILIYNPFLSFSTFSIANAKLFITSFDPLPFYSTWLFMTHKPHHREFLRKKKINKNNAEIRLIEDFLCSYQSPSEFPIARFLWLTGILRLKITIKMLKKYIKVVQQRHHAGRVIKLHTNKSR